MFGDDTSPLFLFSGANIPRIEACPAAPMPMMTVGHLKTKGTLRSDAIVIDRRNLQEETAVAE